jgi:hypothetical protein
VLLDVSWGQVVGAIDGVERGVLPVHRERIRVTKAEVVMPHGHAGHAGGDPALPEAVAVGACQAAIGLGLVEVVPVRPPDAGDVSAELRAQAPGGTKLDCQAALGPALGQ